MTPEAVQRALTAVYGKTGLTLALFRASDEERDSGYSRQPITFAAPSEGKVMSANEQHFGPWASDARGTLTQWALFDGDTEIDRGALDPERPRKPFRNDIIILATGVISAQLSVKV